MSGPPAVDVTHIGTTRLIQHPGYRCPDQQFKEDFAAECKALKAENEALRATVDQWHKRIEHTQCGRSGEPQCECCYDAEPLRAEVQALRADLGDKWQAGYDAGYDQGHADGYEARGRDGGAE